MRKSWRILSDQSPPGEAARLARKLGVSELTARLLYNRGYTDLPAMESFLEPGLRHLSSPDAYPGVAEAAKTMAAELEKGSPMAVWGDYDADGVTSTAMVKDFMAARGIPCGHHIPDRVGEGYGLNIPGIEALAAQGVKLLLTVDCGITSLAEIDRAKELGMTVVVSDHHLPGDSLPRAPALCNPKLGDAPCGELAGVGVAFYLLGALNRLLPGQPLDMRRFLDLVALGTLADVVPLTGENRVLVKNGLLLIKEAARPGIRALKEAAGFEPGAALGAGQVVFGLAPRINAAGRLDHAEKALDLLLARDMPTARPLAAHLDKLNKERRREEEETSAQALEQAQALGPRAGYVLFSENWHPGVVGIVASRITEKLYRPSLVLTMEEGKAKGSGRSISEVDLYAGLAQCAEVLERFGGHRLAAGLGLDPANIGKLAELFDKAVADQVEGLELAPRLTLDAEASFGILDYRLLKELELMQPFGIGNPEPVFLSPPALVTAHKIFAQKHVRLTLRDSTSDVTLAGKAWRMAETLPEYVRGRSLRLAFTPKIDTYGGLASIELNIKDWREVGASGGPPGA